MRKVTVKEKLQFLWRGLWRHRSRPLFLSYLGVLTLGTHWPSSPVPTEWNCDKFVHFGAYFGLSILLWCAYPRSWGSVLGRLGILACGAAGYATIDEVTQLAVPGRVASIADWGADLLGIAIGLCIMHLSAARLVALRVGGGELAK